MTPTDALAAAIRERLVAGRPAPLPGLGTLVRQHVSARVEERPDGSRVLLPPGETIGLTATAPDQETLASAYARFRGVRPGEEEAAFTEAMDQLEARLAATGEARLPGVGLLRRTSGGVVLGVEADLLAAVNRTYEGLTPVPTPSAASPTSSPPLQEPVGEDEPIHTGVFRDVETLEPAEDPDALSFEPEGQLPARPEHPPDEAEEPSQPETSFTDGNEWEDEPVGPTGEVVVQPEDDSFPEELHAASDPESDGADLPEGLAVPFGEPGGESLEDVFPPTPPADDPAVFDEDSDADLDDDDIDAWVSSTWASAGAEPPEAPPSDSMDQSIEDAEVVDDWGDAHEDGAADPVPENDEAATVEAPLEPDPAPVFPPLPKIPEGVEIDRVGPADEEAPPPPVEEPLADPMGETADAAAAGAFVGLEGLEPPPPSPPAVPSRPAARPAARHEPPQPSFPRWGWLLALLVLALIGIALAIGWDRSQSPAPDATVPVADPLAEADRQPPAETESSNQTLLGADVDEAGAPSPTTPPPTDGAEAAAPSAPAGTPRARGGAEAVLPPRLVGLPDEDQRALSGAPVDPAAGGWTLVVFSTPLSDLARSERTRYQEAGYRTAIIESSVGDRTWYRVAVGQFDSREDAARLRDRLPPQAPPETWQLDLSTL